MDFPSDVAGMAKRETKTVPIKSHDKGYASHVTVELSSSDCAS